MNSPNLRRLAVLLALTAGLAAPSSALAHGVAHARASHAGDEHDTGVGEHELGPSEPHAPVIHEPEHPDHAHPRVELMTTGQSQARPLVAAPLQQVTIPAIAASSAVKVIPVGEKPRPDLSGTPPPRLRGPPSQ